LLSAQANKRQASEKQQQSARFRRSRGPGYTGTFNPSTSRLVVVIFLVKEIERKSYTVQDSFIAMSIAIVPFGFISAISATRTIIAPYTREEDFDSSVGQNGLCAILEKVQHLAVHGAADIAVRDPTGILKDKSQAGNCNSKVIREIEEPAARFSNVECEIGARYAGNSLRATARDWISKDDRGIDWRTAREHGAAGNQDGAAKDQETTQSGHANSSKITINGNVFSTSNAARNKTRHAYLLY
jgi:hypothetical protein